MALIEIECTSWQYPGEPLQIRLPYGILKGAFQALDEIPTASGLIAKLMGMLETALMPVRQLLEMVEVFAALIQCVQAVPKAILQLSPTPVFDCLSNLMKVAARLLQKIPPISYAVALADVCRFMVYLIDEIFRLLQRVDQLIDGYVNILVEAQQLGDVELVNFANCGMQNLRVSLGPLLNALLLIQPIVSVLMIPILRLIPTPEMQKASDQALEALVYLAQALVNLATPGLDLPQFGGTAPPPQLPQIPIPKLSPLLEVMIVLRSGMVITHKALCPVFRESSDLETRAAPTFVYL